MSTLNELNGTYVIDPTHTRVGFVARHAMVTKVRGSFNEVEGTASIEQGGQNGRIELTVQAASVDTRNADRDNHLRTSEFFEADQYPTITFRSTDVVVDGDTLRVTGDLTIKDVTKPVTIDFAYEGAATDPFGNQRIGFEGSVQVQRSEWGLNFNAALETGGVLVSEKVTLEFEVSAIKQA